MKAFVFWKDSVMLSQKFPRTWQIYLPLTYHSSLLEVSVNNSPSNLSDPHVGEIVVEEGLQPPLHQQELPYFNQARNCSCRSAKLALEKLDSRLFSVYLSIQQEQEMASKEIPFLLLHDVCHWANEQARALCCISPLSPWYVATNTLALERELLVLIFTCG